MLCGHRCGIYVELEMYGLPTDTVRRRYKTKTVQSTQMNTVWNEEQWVFKKVWMDYGVLIIKHIHTP